MSIPIEIHMFIKKLHVPLRYKILVLLVTLPLVTLGLYLAMATAEFESDKMAYVHGSSAAVARSVSIQVRSEIENIVTRTRPILGGFDGTSSRFSENSIHAFNADSKLKAIAIFKHEKGQQPQQLAELALNRELRENPQFRKAWNVELKKQAGLIDTYIGRLSEDLFSASFPLGDGEKSKLRVVCLFQSNDLIQSFQGTGAYNLFLMSSAGEIVVQPEKHDFFENWPAVVKALQTVLADPRPGGSEELSLSEAGALIVAFSDTGLPNLKVISIVSKEEALQAVEILLIKSLVFFLALICITIVISVIASTHLTSTLKELYDATQKIAEGDFSVRVRGESTDELGALAKNFNWMAEEVSRLMLETAEKARLESELATVHVVQETLFPEKGATYGDLCVSGYFEPASECGGDWWSYSKVGDKLFLWIGDATGHGAPSALITSAARSAAAIIETIPGIDPAKALSILNRAIYMTSKSKIMMTFFLGVIDLKTNRLSYANASHDPPYLIKSSSDKKIKRRDLTPLNNVNGPRLGQQLHADYELASLDLSLGERVFLYTDGIIDVESPSGEVWGERAFLKTLVELANQGKGPEDLLDGFKASMNNFRQGAPLKDDVTMFVCHRQEAA